MNSQFIWFSINLTQFVGANTHSNVTSTTEVEIRLFSDEIVPQSVRQWLSAFACSNDMTSKMLLCSSLVSMSCLLDHTMVKLCGSYEEKANLHLIATAPSGTGKTPACQKRCVEVIVGHIEEKIQARIVIDETSSSSLFNHFLGGLCYRHCGLFLRVVISTLVL